MLDNGNRIEINLPNATVEQAGSSFKAVEVAIERDGGVFVNGLPISNSNQMILIKELESLSGGDMSKPVVLYADGEVSHQSVVNIMSIIKNIGFEGLQLAIESETVSN